MITHPLGRRGLLPGARLALAGALAAAGGGGAPGRALLSGSGESGDLSSGETAFYIILCVFLVVLSGIAAGLTLGLLSIDALDLEVAKRTGSPKEKWMASKVEPLLVNPHWLLVSLLLINAGCFESLPIFLDRCAASGGVGRRAAPSTAGGADAQRPSPDPPPPFSPLQAPEPRRRYPDLGDRHPDLRRDPAAGGAFVATSAAAPPRLYPARSPCAF
jgi:hypothetical protein